MEDNQRIAIARAFYKNSSVIVFDEATSADYQTEKEIMEEINKFKNKMNYSVSHRLETLNFCNKIIKIENGNVKQKVKNFL